MRLPLSLVRSSMIGYASLFVVSLGLAYWQGRLGAIFTFPGWGPIGVNAGIGILLAAAVLSAGRAFRGTFRWARELEAEFRLFLAPLDSWGVFLLAAASGIAEETFFRAIMQPVFGLGVTSLVFGVLHYPMNRRMIPWTVLATVMGFVFGAVYESTGSLLAVALGHGLINFFELAHIGRLPPPAPGDGGFPAPGSSGNP